MGRIRVIAVECCQANNKEAVLSCVYKQEAFHVYDTHGQLYLQREYFSDFNSLDFYIKKGKYEWTDFWIEKGQTIYRNEDGLIYADDKRIPAFAPLGDGQGEIGRVSLKLFYEFLKTANRNNASMIKEITTEFENGSFRQQVSETVRENPLTNILALDKEIIVKTRILERKYIIDYVKKLLSSDDEMRISKITFFFTRLFKLEEANYVMIE